MICKDAAFNCFWGLGQECLGCMLYFATRDPAVAVAAVS